MHFLLGEMIANFDSVIFQLFFPVIARNVTVILHFTLKGIRNCCSVYPDFVLF